MTMSIIKISGSTKNEKSMMKLVRLAIFRPLLLKCEILGKFDSLKNLKDLYTNPLNFSNFQPTQNLD